MKNNQSNAEYNRYVDAVTPKHSCLNNCIHAFITGGIICCIGQLVYDICITYFELNKDDSAGYTCMILIALSIILTGFNVYKPIVKYGGAGALVPITGFANSVAAPTIEFQKEGEVFGKGVKVFTIAGPVILFGIVTSIILGLIYYVCKMIGIM